VSSIIGTFLVRVKEGGSPHRALNIGEITAGVILLIGAFIIIGQVLPDKWTVDGKEFTSMGVFGAIALGLVSGIAIGYITEHYTGTGTKPVIGIVRQSVTGSATNIIAGLGVGMISTALPIIVLASTILASYHLAGLYGIAIAAVGMLSNTGIQLAVDAYGPISDNAGGIAEMSELEPEVRQRTDKLDAVGNTTAAIGKGFAIGSAALTALALFAAFKTTWEATHDAKLSIEVTDPKVVAALFVGGMLPFLFSAFSMEAVGRAAMSMIEEVRRQFREIPGLKAGLDAMNRNEDKSMDEWSEEDRGIFDQAISEAEYGKCVEISTKAAIREMIKPGLLAVAAPVLVGFIGGAEMLGGLLAGVTVTGVLLALFQSNAGGAWDNAKKMIEEGFEVNGEQLGKGTEAHKAAVVGDTVGDPFKDTSGPSLNILLKLMSVVALVIASMI
jgi:K(+)-stimulated pyrophosphate-energized sodium pump